MNQELAPLRSELEDGGNPNGSRINPERRDATKWLRWLVTLAYFVLLNYMLLTPNPWGLFGFEPSAPAPDLGGIDLNGVMHVVTFAFLTALVIWASRAESLHAILLWVVAACAFGVVTECLQHFVPNRAADVADAIKDSLGSVLGCLPMIVFRRMIRSFRP